MSQRIRDLPRMKELASSHQLLRAMLALAPIARPFVRWTGRDLTAFDRKVTEMRGWEQTASDLVSVPDRFNDAFGDRGWIIYEAMNFELATACVVKAEGGDLDGAERDLIEAITPETIKWGLMLMRGIGAFEPRMDLAEKARVDYAEGRYYASVLVTLSLLDGLVRELQRGQKGFFSSDVPLAAWDLASAHGTGLQRLARLLQEQRNRTTTEPLHVPYRHGIVHGRDLGYDNKPVAAKAWAALFAIQGMGPPGRSEEAGCSPSKAEAHAARGASSPRREPETI